MSNVVLDLRQNLELTISVNHNVVYYPSFDNLNQLDNEYTILLNEGKSNEKEYNNTNIGGLTLVPETKSIVWELNSGDFNKGNHFGYLKSTSNIAGVYLYIKLNLIIE